tara:strand:+ start:154 stop:339 length:186 start_codon:yes stop_codon:yes gene_type:complete
MSLRNWILLFCEALGVKRIPYNPFIESFTLPTHVYLTKPIAITAKAQMSICGGEGSLSEAK